MNGPDWPELERAWQDEPMLEPVRAELRQERRWRWLSSAYFGFEMALTVAVAAACALVFILGPEKYAVLAAAMFVLILFAGGLSYQARQVPQASDSDPVLASVKSARRRAEIGVRLALATLWASVACILVMIIAILALSKPLDPPRLFVIAGGLSWIAFFTAGTLIYLRRRMRELARLQAIEERFRAE